MQQHADEEEQEGVDEEQSKGGFGVEGVRVFKNGRERVDSGGQVAGEAKEKELRFR